MAVSLEQFTLAIILAALFAIIYLLRVLVLLERRIARMDDNLFRITRKIVKEEKKIEYEFEHPCAAKPATPAKKRRR